MSWKDYAENNGVEWEYSDNSALGCREYTFRYGDKRLDYLIPYVVLKDFPEKAINEELKARVCSLIWGRERSIEHE